MRPPSLALAFLLGCAPLVGQQGSAETGPPLVTVTAGIGNSVGWFGAQGERYFHGRRISAFGGLGYTPEIDPGDPTGVTFAGGLRGYTGGRNHRGFLELSVSQVALVRTRIRTSAGTSTVDGERLYGPGLQLGYQFVSDGWFTAAVSGGAGYAVGTDDAADSGPVQALLTLAIGYTWR